MTLGIVRTASFLLTSQIRPTDWLSMLQVQIFRLHFRRTGLLLMYVISSQMFWFWMLEVYGTSFLPCTLLILPPWQRLGLIVTIMNVSSNSRGIMCSGRVETMCEVVEFLKLSETTSHVYKGQIWKLRLRWLLLKFVLTLPLLLSSLFSTNHLVQMSHFL